MDKTTVFGFKPTQVGDYKIIDVTYHRNGVGGDGFMTGVFKATKGETKGLTFVFTMFQSFSGWKEGKKYEEADEYTFENACGDYKCAVLCLTHIEKSKNVQSAWRGDVMYHDVVQPAIVEYQRQRDEYYKL